MATCCATSTVCSGGREIGARLCNPDFVKLAESFGLAGRRVSTPARERELDDALSRDALALIGVAIETGSEVSPWESLMPPSRRRAPGAWFARDHDTAATRAASSGALSTARSDPALPNASVSDLHSARPL
jgi:hypothetical protein